MTFSGVVRPLALDEPGAAAAAYDVETAATRQVRPRWVPLGEAARVAAWRANNGWRHRLVGAFEGDRLIGVAGCATAEDTPDTAWISVSVLPEEQRRGVGSLLVHAAEAMNPPRVDRFVGTAYRAEKSELSRLVNGFARHLGYAEASTETVVELDLLTAQLPAVEPAPGFTVSTFVDGVPDELRTQVGVLKGLVDAEAPSGDLAWQPTPVTPEQYEGELALWARQGRKVIESVALTAAGEVAAWTCLVVAADVARAAEVEGTLVLDGHRGRGLGRAVKAASLEVARELGGAARVRTSSDDQNVWMRAINEELGFVPVESEVVLHKRRTPPV